MTVVLRRLSTGPTARSSTMRRFSTGPAARYPTKRRSMEDLGGFAPPPPPILPLSSSPPRPSTRLSSSTTPGSSPSIGSGSGSSIGSGSGSSIGSLSPPLSPRTDLPPISTMIFQPHHLLRCHPRKSSDSAATRTSRALVARAFALLALCAVGVGLRRLDALVKERDDLLRRRESELRLRRDADARLRRAALDRADALAEAAELRREKERAEREATEHRARREKEAMELREEIQRHSRREVLDKFGPGPHRVELKLELPSTQDGRRALHYVVVELAPLSLMPHAVNTFLNQVSQKLWDGTEIFRNREHILMTRLEDPAKRRAGVLAGEVRAREFRRSGLFHLSFPEHSTGYPHERHTLGFAGRPGGPHFYFNKIDNTIDHGPDPDDDGGDADGDPCFARVVRHADVLDRISELPTTEDDVLIEPVVIREAYVLKRRKDGTWTHHA